MQSPLIGTQAIGALRVAFRSNISENIKTQIIANGRYCLEELRLRSIDHCKDVLPADFEMIDVLLSKD